MTTRTRWLSIVGIGEDGVAGLSPAARDLIQCAELVVGGRRHLALADTLIGGERLSWPSPIEAAFPELLKWRGRAVVVMATGDPFHFGIGKQLAALLSAEDFVVLPQPSAFSLAAARLGWSLQDTALVSVHGRALEGIVRHLHPGARILALSWDGTTPSKLAELLRDRGLERSRITVLEALGGPRESVQSAEAQTFALDHIDPLNTVAIEVIGGPDARIGSLACGLDDALFEHDGQLTKREIRAITLSALAPQPGELLWDIGLGAGSIAIEWLLRHPAMRAVGFEQDAARAARAQRNALFLGAPDLEIVDKPAPQALEGLSPPDAVFIGGGLGDGALEAAWGALKRGGRLVANAVTLEGEARLFEAYRRFGGELVRIDVARADAVGSLTGWKAGMPIVQWRGLKR